MPADPRPHTARRPDGLEDTDLELRFDAIFRTLGTLARGLPEDLAAPVATLESQVQALRDDLTLLQTADVTQDDRLSDIETRLSNAGIP